ncbi:MAG TPA: SUMF1/EgtB/PvdO family nonheme iron enzyme [Kofleriaceae bacterium]|nr:SUMF1/EgtB/PvdO family nonheme iron enzyme [Kofleriaceae bacterium]
MRTAVALVAAIVACGGDDGGAAPIDAGDPDVATTPDGTWDRPFVIDALPFAVDGTTVGASERRVANYSCAPAIFEGGAEVVYRVDLAEATIVAIAVAAAAGDVDVHVLRSPAESSCIARDDRALVADLAPGSWWIAVDTYSGMAGEMPGPYHLTIDVPRSTACLENPIPACAAGDTPDVNGPVAEPAGIGGCPPGMTPAGTACIDRWEAALLLEENDVIAGWSPYANPGTRRVRAVSAPGVVPQGYINGVQAAAACANAGKRLCTDVEWLRACQGAAGTTYPYGATRENGRCNDARTCHPAVQYFESNDSSVFGMIGHACLDQLPDGLARTGSHDACVSADGAFDLMGNLHEWTADPAGTFRGGFFVDTRLNGDGCLYRTTAHDTSHWDYSTGFRCCADLP